MEITQGDFTKPIQESGPLLNRLVWLSLEQTPNTTVLQLEEARYHSNGSGYHVNILGKPLSLHNSFICTDYLLFGQSSQGEKINTDYCSSLAQSKLVSTIV